MNGSTKDAIRVLSKHQKGLGNELFSLILDKEEKVTSKEIEDIFWANRTKLDTESFRNSILAVTMLRPDQAGEWLKTARQFGNVRLSCFGDFCYGYLLGVLGSISWLSEKGQYPRETNLGETFRKFLISDMVEKTSDIIPEEWKKKVLDQAIADQVDAVVKAAKKDPKLRADLANLLRRCISLKSKNGTIPPLAKQVINEIQYKIFAELGVEKRSTVIYKFVDKIAEK